MSEYSFETLNDKDFELLVRDLLQEEYHIRFESFKSGKDKGIDLRYSTSTDHIIVQCKHWINSGVSALKSELKNKEKKKIEQLNPKRYILVTSLKLSPFDKESIKKDLSPFIIQESDIIGSETLNNLLTLYPRIEENHYKLWLSSSNILRKIQTEYIRERSESYAEDLYDRMKVFVSTKSYVKAQKILEQFNVLLITGEPGIGKTMLADYLVFKYIRDDFKLTYIYKDLEDIEEVFKKDEKQIFYFDDFLGRNYLEVLSERKFDSHLNHLIRAIQKSDSHYLVLTSRTTIYNTARRKSEFISDEKVNALNYQIELSDYNDLERGKILYNHMYFSNFDSTYREQIIKDRFYWKIISHRNFNPRLIDFITDKSRLEISRPENYTEFILESLDNPTRIWEKAFKNQISELDQIFLLTLFSFKTPIAENLFRNAFKARLEYEREKNGFKIPVGYYNQCISDLLNGFIIRHIHSNLPGQDYKLDFINPSVEDYLITLVKSSYDDAERIIKSAIYFEQISFRFIENDILKGLFDYKEFSNKIIHLLKKGEKKEITENIRKIFIGLSFISYRESHLELMKILYEEGTHYHHFLITYTKSVLSINDCKEYFLNNKDYNLERCIYSVSNLVDLENLGQIIEEIDENPNEYFRDYFFDLMEELKPFIQDYFNDVSHSKFQINNGYDRRFESALKQNIEEVYEDLTQDLIFDLESCGLSLSLLNDYYFYDFYDISLTFDRLIESYGRNYHKDEKLGRYSNKGEYRSEINDLFS